MQENKFETPQTDFWKGEFGASYTDRNSGVPGGWDAFYIANYGLSKIEMNAQFIGELPEETSFLEVGCNIGMQLVGLQRMGFKKIYGIELQEYAVEKAKEYTKNINILSGSGFDLPFKDSYFDVVCTNGVLIHIAPNDLPRIMSEMYRCSAKYIWGFEYYAEEVTDIPYRGHKDRLWKGDYAALFMKQFKDLKLVKKEIFDYQSAAEKGNRDCMYLLEKG